MKKHNQDAYVKVLERRLATTEEENKLLKLKAEVYQTAIQIAEEQFQIPILKKSAGPPAAPNGQPTDSSAPAARAIPWWAWSSYVDCSG